MTKNNEPISEVRRILSKHTYATHVHVRKITEASDNICSDLQKRIETPSPLSVTINEQPFTKRVIDIKSIIGDTWKVVNRISKSQNRKHVHASCAAEAEKNKEFDGVDLDADDDPAHQKGDTKALSLKRARTEGPSASNQQEEMPLKTTMK